MRQTILRAMMASGLGSVLLKSAWRNARLAILCYHGVSLDDEHYALPELYIPPAQLRGRLDLLRSLECNVLSLQEGLHRLYEGELPPRSVVLTFDDGTRDFSQIVAPLLQEYSMPATVYLTTYYCHHLLPVFNTAMRYLLWRGRAVSIDLGQVLGGPFEGQLSLETASNRALGWSTISAHTVSNKLSAAAKHELLGKVAQHVGVDLEAFIDAGQFSLMTPGQVSALPAPLIDVQLHTHRHRTPRDESSFSREIIDNRRSIDRLRSGTLTEHFCYPSGDYSKAFLPWLSRLGVKSATTCVPGLASPRSNPLLLPRFIDTTFASETTFAAWITGTAELLPRRRNYRLVEERA